jgi:hypothetical protein
VLATNDTRFILVPAGAVRPAVVCSGHCIASHRGARRGGLQAWWERRPGLQVPEVLIEASANIVEKAESVWVVAVRRLVSPRLGDCPSFYRPRREQFTCVPHYSSYVWKHGEQCHGADGRPGESSPSRGVVVRLVLVQARFRGWQRSGWLSGRCSGPIRGCRRRGVRTRHSGSHGDVLSPRTPTASRRRHSARRGAAVAGMAAQSQQRRG